VPDESTVRKLVRRLGPETVNELTRVVIGKAQRETRFAARAVRIDSTVVEADIRYPTDAGLAWQGARSLAREGRKLTGRLRGPTRRVVDRSRQLGRLVRAISRTLVRRTDQRREAVMELNAKAGRLLDRSVGEARALAAQARASARGRGAQAKLRAAQRLKEVADGCQRIADQIRQRQRGAPIPDRLVSLADPDARPIRKGKLGTPKPVRLCRPAGRGHRQYPPRRPRLSAGGGDRPGQPGREPPAWPDRRRAGPPGASTPGGRPRRRVPARADRTDPGRARTD
jgi:transposase, IS5 family